jgi:hypothetical protein
MQFVQRMGVQHTVPDAVMDVVRLLVTLECMMAPAREALEWLLHTGESPGASSSTKTAAAGSSPCVHEPRMPRSLPGASRCLEIPLLDGQARREPYPGNALTRFAAKLVREWRFGNEVGIGGAAGSLSPNPTTTPAAVMPPLAAATPAGSLPKQDGEANAGSDGVGRVYGRNMPAFLCADTCNVHDLALFDVAECLRRGRVADDTSVPGE